MNNILTLSFRGPEADECQKILEAIMVSYQNFLDEAYKNVSETTLDLILQAQTQLKDGVQRAAQAHQDYRLKNPYTIFGRGESGKGVEQARCWP